MLFITFLIAILSLANSALANDNNQGIEVNGRATVMVEANTFLLTIVIAEAGTVTSKLKILVDHRSKQVINFAKKMGIKKDYIDSARINLRTLKNKPSIQLNGVEAQTSFGKKQGSVYLSPNSHQSVPLTQMKNKPIKFELSRRITFRLENIKNYDRFLDGVIKIGVTKIYPVQMSVDESDSYYQQALLLAIKNAKAKALKIAQQMGISLGSLVYLSETSTNRYQSTISTRMSTSNPENYFSSSVGKNSISASVIIKYAIAGK